MVTQKYLLGVEGRGELFKGITKEIFWYRVSLSRCCALLRLRHRHHDPCMNPSECRSTTLLAPGYSEEPTQTAGASVWVLRNQGCHKSSCLTPLGHHRKNQLTAQALRGWLESRQKVRGGFQRRLMKTNSFNSNPTSLIGTCSFTQ